MAPVLEFFTAKDGEVKKENFEGSISIFTDRTGENVIATPQMAWLPKEPGDEISYTPDDKGKILVNRTPVTRLILRRDSDVSLFDGVYVKESRR